MKRLSAVVSWWKCLELMKMIEFKELNVENLFDRMAIDVVVSGMSFAEFMVKLKHLDRSWSNG